MMGGYGKPRPPFVILSSRVDIFCVLFSSMDC